MAAQRTYTVVEVMDEGLKVISAEVIARRAEEACDRVVETLPVPERTGRFAAFLASSYREFEYDTEPAVVTRKRRVGDVIPDPEPTTPHVTAGDVLGDIPSPTMDAREAEAIAELEMEEELEMADPADAAVMDPDLPLK